MIPPKPELLKIEGPAGTLELAVEDPQTAAAHYAVICHPHPLFGGTMDNKVVTTLARACSDCDVPALRFNFRGVGASTGTHDAGRGEIDDAETVARYAASRWPGRALIAAGFSFGGYIAYRLALKMSPARLITVAPAITRFETTLERPDCPWLIVQGDQDDVVDPKAVEAWARALKPPPQLRLVAGVGHFFHGRLQELREAVVAAIRNG